MSKLVFSPSQQAWNQYAGGGTGETDSEHFWMAHKLAVETDALWKAQNTGIPSVVVNEGSWEKNVAKSNALGATEHLGMHTNAGGGHGTEIYFHSGDAKSQKLANALYPFIASASNMPDRGVKASSSLGEVKAKAAAVIIEYLYHDNTTEAQEMRTSIHEFAVATVKGLCRYYGKTYRTPTVPVPSAVVLPPTVKYGAKGWPVPTLQKKLNAKKRWWDKAIVVDGKFGASTLEAVRKFQSRNRLQVNGVVGASTWKKLYS